MYKDGYTFEDMSIEHQEMIAKHRGITVSEIRAGNLKRQNQTSQDSFAMMAENNEFPDDWSEERKANYLLKFSTPSTSIVTHSDGSRTAYQAPSSDDKNGEWDIYPLDKK
jgi:hypothetical protein